MRKLLIILGVPIDDLNMEEALERLDRFVAEGRKTGKSHQVATVNADFVVKAARDVELRQILLGADMATADGMPLVWGARALGVPLEGRVTGADLVPALAERAAQKDYSLYLLGAAPGIAARAAEILKERHPGLKIVGVKSPPKRSVAEMIEKEEETQKILDDIRAASPDFLLVAFGNPKQEKWISLYSKELSVPVMIGVGGTLDFIAGKTKRAPEWMQRTGLEWLFRLIQEPRRLWRRYVVDLFGFGSFFLQQWWIMRQGGPVENIVPEAEIKPPPVITLEPDEEELSSIEIEFTSETSTSHVEIEQELTEINPEPNTTTQAPITTAHAATNDSQEASQSPAILEIIGRLDISNVIEFTEKAEKALAKNSYLIINLAQTDFLDSRALGALVGLTKQARDAGGEVWLAAVPTPIERVLSLLRLDRFFKIQPDIDSILESFVAESLVEPISNYGDWTIIKMPERLDGSTAPDVLNQGLQILNTSVRLILDFSQTIFLASAGLAAMLKLSRQAEKIGGEVRVAGCSNDVLRTIQMARFDKVLLLFDDIEAASA